MKSAPRGIHAWKPASLQVVLRLGMTGLLVTHPVVYQEAGVGPTGTVWVKP
jgi:hypothetical protein